MLMVQVQMTILVAQMEILGTQMEILVTMVVTVVTVVTMMSGRHSALMFTTATKINYSSLRAMV